MKKIGKETGRHWLLLVVAVPAAFAVEVSIAAPWIEKSETIGQAWDDLPFLGPPQRRSQRQPQSPETRRALETKRELQRELHRAPEVDRAANQKPAANVFPPPRLPTEARSVPQPAEARNATASAPQSRTAATRSRDAEQELQRELNRTLPHTAVLPVGEPLACAERLARIARYSPLPGRAGPDGCGAADLVRLDSILMPDRTTVALNPPPQIRCSMAEQFAEWVREDVGPAAVELGSPLLSISDNDAYDCRPRNGVKGAQLSEHGKGNALDITGIRLRNGGVFTLADQQVTKAFRDKVRTAACGRFMTVLGPGSDAYHASHVHLDMAERKHNVKVCQWNVRETEVASRIEPAPPAPAVTSAPPVAAVPVVPPPPTAVEPPPMPPVASEPPAQIAEAPRQPVTEPSKELTEAPKPEVQQAEVPSRPEQRAEPQQVQAPQVQAPQIHEQSSRREMQTAEAAAQLPEQPSGPQNEKPEAPSQQAADASPQAVESPPLPRRKPEALLVLAQMQQFDAQDRNERERWRRYDSRRHIERDVRRFLRNFF